MTIPRITVVTPSFNQADFLQRTIESVLSQNYSNLEYIVIDGGSTDGSAATIAKYARHLAYWCSEPDRGQSHAINKGFARSTGEILCWLNSDDYFSADALRIIGELLRSGTGRFAATGHHVHVSPAGEPLKLLRGKFVSRRHLLKYWNHYSMHQPSTFWRREVHDRIGALDETLHLIMDYDYWLRVSEHFSFANVDHVLSYGHRHPGAKTFDEFQKYDAALRDHARAQWRKLPAHSRLSLELQEMTYGRTLLPAYRAVRDWSEPILFKMVPALKPAGWRS